MDYEKKYKNALEWARRVMQGEVGFVLDEVLEKFPELKESDDERMLREIKRYIKEQGNKPTGLPNGTAAVADMIAWLEKQGEQKPAWSEEDENMLKTIHNSIDVECLFKNGVEYLDMMYWFKSLKDRVLLQPKQEWSEEDERALIDAIVALSMYANGNIPHILPSILLEDVEKLKSLRPQKRWKPTKGQIKALEDAIEFLGCTKKVREDLKLLYEQLKKLMEE